MNVSDWISSRGTPCKDDVVSKILPWANHCSSSGQVRICPKKAVLAPICPKKEVANGVRDKPSFVSMSETPLIILFPPERLYILPVLVHPPTILPLIFPEVNRFTCDPQD